MTVEHLSDLSDLSDLSGTGLCLLLSGGDPASGLALPSETATGGT
jgi:hypothetical protein